MGAADRVHESKGFSINQYGHYHCIIYRFGGMQELHSDTIMLHMYGSCAMASQACTCTIYTYRTVYRVKSSRCYIYMKGSDLGGTFTETLVSI